MCFYFGLVRLAFLMQSNVTVLNVILIFFSFVGLLLRFVHF